MHTQPYFYHILQWVLLRVLLMVYFHASTSYSAQFRDLENHVQMSFQIMYLDILNPDISVLYISQQVPEVEGGEPAESGVDLDHDMNVPLEIYLSTEVYDML